MKKFCTILKKHGIEIINFVEKKMLSLTEDQKKKYSKQKFCPICKQEFNEEFDEYQNYCKV